MKNIFKLLLLVFITSFMLTSCIKQSPTSDRTQQLQTEQSLQEANREIGMPAIINYTEKKQLKLIYELCDQENLICHVYLFNEMEGKIGQYLGECLGFGIPYSTQYSNPDKIIDMAFDISTRQYGTISQAEPNGLFKPTGLSATWIILFNPETKEPRPVYVEPLIIVSPFKLH